MHLTSLEYDRVNAIFEFGGAAFNTLNIRRVLKDRRVEGVSLIPFSFFSLWGVWNIAYYSGLGQSASWLAGITLTSVNLTWLALAIFFSRKKLGTHI